MLYKNTIENTIIRKLITLSIPVFVAVSIFFTMYIQKMNVNNSYIALMEYVIVVILSLFFLRELLLLQQVTVLHRYPMFWISVGILFYYTGNLIIEGMFNYMISHSMQLALRLYNLSYILKYLLFLLFIIGAFCNIFPSRVNKTVTEHL